MPISFKYWDDRLDPEDMRLMWPDPQVSIEWINAREMRGQKVHLSQDPDGEVYLTQTEMMVSDQLNSINHDISSCGIACVSENQTELCSCKSLYLFFQFPI